MNPEISHEDLRPSLSTERLYLRPFQLSDAKDVQRMAGHPLVYATTATIPHPYPDGAAEAWISKHSEWYRDGVGVQFAITAKKDQALLGCIDLFGISKAHKKAEIGYWIGVDYWNQGICSEAAREVVKFGFCSLQLNKIIGRYAVHNPNSGRIMKKLGMQKVGVLRQDFFRDGKFSDIMVYEILRSG